MRQPRLSTPVSVASPMGHCAQLAMQSSSLAYSLWSTHEDMYTSQYSAQSSAVPPLLSPIVGSVVVAVVASVSVASVVEAEVVSVAALVGAVVMPSLAAVLLLPPLSSLPTEAELSPAPSSLPLPLAQPPTSSAYQNHDIAFRMLNSPVESAARAA